MSTSYTLEEILEKQCEKLQDLEIATIFVKSKVKFVFFNLISYITIFIFNFMSRQRCNERRTS